MFDIAGWQSTVWWGKYSVVRTQPASDPVMPASFPSFLSFFLSFFAGIGLIFDMIQVERHILAVCIQVARYILAVCIQVNARKLFYTCLFIYLFICEWEGYF